MSYTFYSYNLNTKLQYRYNLLPQLYKIIKKLQNRYRMIASPMFELYDFVPCPGLLVPPLNRACSICLRHVTFLQLTFFICNPTSRMWPLNASYLILMMILNILGILLGDCSTMKSKQDGMRRNMGNYAAENTEAGSSGIEVEVKYNEFYSRRLYG